MKSLFNNSGILITTFLFIILLNHPLESIKKRYAFIGIKKCAKCHSADSIGSQYDKWLRSPHSKGVLILKTKNALTIAKNLSIDNPADNRKCLKCHTTGGGKVEATKDEGVGCEACHGPGSVYYEYGNHVDLINREGAYGKGMKYGMYPIIGIKRIKKREKLCLHCHNSRRPCYPSDTKGIYRQTISLQVISEMKKGDLILKHPLIPPFPQY